jgi:hypothetical protein
MASGDKRYEERGMVLVAAAWAAERNLRVAGGV